MTNNELNAMYERKKKETLDKFLGPGSPYPAPDPIEHRFIDKNWSTGKSWRDEPRILKNPNHDTAFLKEYNELKRKNGGRVVTYIEPPSEDDTSTKK